MSQSQREQVAARLRDNPLDITAPIDQVRAAFVEMTSGRPLPAQITTEQTTLAGRPAVAFTGPGAEPDARILYFHGGSFIVGSPWTAAGLTASLVARTGVSAVSLDYRLAPEHPFPAGIEDCVAAYAALLEQGLPAEGIVLAGDSAGGGLTITSLLAARDRGLPMPAAVVAFSPGLDATGSGASMVTKNGIDRLFDADELRSLRVHYLAGQDPAQPLLSPAVYADPTGLPPLLLQVGSHEVLLDDSVRFAARAAAADVDVILDVTAGVPHVFQSWTAMLDEADAALDRAGAFIRERLQRRPANV